jgi:hypothetical protein
MECPIVDLGHSDLPSPNLEWAVKRAAGHFVPKIDVKPITLQELDQVVSQTRQDDELTVIDVSDCDQDTAAALMRLSDLVVVTAIPKDVEAVTSLVKKFQGIAPKPECTVALTRSNTIDEASDAHERLTAAGIHVMAGAMPNA